MKKIKYYIRLLSIFYIVTLLFTSCSKDEKINLPFIEDEKEENIKDNDDTLKKQSIVTVNNPYNYKVTILISSELLENNTSTFYSKTYFLYDSININNLSIIYDGDIFYISLK